MARFLRPFLALVLILSISLVSGCASSPKGSTGAILGSTAGGLIAAAAGGGTAGIIGGILLGGLAGAAVGTALDQRDKELAMKNAQLALEGSRTGETTAWENPDSQASGTITPKRTYQNAEGQYCRDFKQTIVVEGKKEQATGTACRQSDGTWKIQG